MRKCGEKYAYINCTCLPKMIELIVGEGKEMCSVSRREEVRKSFWR